MARGDWGSGAAVERFRCSLSEPLLGDLDPAERAARMPPSYVVKGMFFRDLVDRLGPGGWESVAPTLRWPPQGGRYVAFKDYPQYDHLLITCEVARRRYSAHPLREGLRRLGRDDMRTFGESTLGGVMLSIARDPRTALHKVPTVYSKVAPGDWTIGASDIDGGVCIEFTQFHGDWCYQVGQLEGIVMHYGVTPEVTVESRGIESVRFEVRLLL